MANKIKLGQRPKTFKEIEIKVTLPDGTDGIIPVTFKYRDKKEFGAWQDSIKSLFPTMETGDDFSWETFYGATSDSTASLLLDAIDSWGLDAPLNSESLVELEACCGAAVLPSIIAAYGAACREGRLGN